MLKSKKILQFLLPVLALSLLASCTNTLSGSTAGGRAPSSVSAGHSSSAAAASSAANTVSNTEPASPGKNSVSSSEVGKYIPESQAKKAAFEHAGVLESDVDYIYIHLDLDDGAMVYDVEFLSAGQEYDYEIDALSGAVLSVDRETEFAYLQPQGEADQYIGENAAKQAALSHAGLNENNVTFVYSKLDRDDGRWKYEIEFYHSNTEYDYDIDAVTGEILSFDQEAEHHDLVPYGASITEDAALQAALSRAGVELENTSNLRTRLDHDDGRVVYEIEWQVGRTEYSCEIDANTGEILQYEQEND